MEWKKVPDASKAWAGGTHPKAIYRAIYEGKCKAARIGAGRNLLVCEAFIDEWLKSTVREGRKDKQPAPTNSASPAAGTADTGSNHRAVEARRNDVITTLATGRDCPAG
jgi:hypothetical protein